MSGPESYCGSELELFAAARRWKAYIRTQLAPFVRGRVLEVGAGLGATTAVLAALPHDSWLCLEPDAAQAAEISRQVAVGALPPVQVRRGTVAALAAEERFDAILYIDVLEHIADDAAEMAAAARHLAPGGALVVLSPAHPELYSAFDKAIGHYRRYRRASLRAAMPAGLDLACLHYLDGVGMLASLLNRLLLRKDLPTRADIALWDGVMVPASRLLDPLLGYRLGRSILGVWRR